MKSFIHKKTGNMYILLNDDLIECTNGREDKKYCLYVNLEGMVFIREHDEFYQKFEKWEISNELLDKSENTADSNTYIRSN